MLRKKYMIIEGGRVEKEEQEKEEIKIRLLSMELHAQHDKAHPRTPGPCLFARCKKMIF